MYDLAETKARSTVLDPKSKSTRPRNVALIGNYPPRRCGIATFTADLRAAIKGADETLKCDVIALTDPDGAYEYDDAVTGSIHQNVLADYGEMARRLNDEGVDLVCLQHEYGIFGGPAGENVLTLVNALSCPVVTTLHTVLEQPDPDQARVMNELVRRSARVVVMNERGREILMRVYAAPERKIEVIPHGAPDYPLVDTEQSKARLGFGGRDVLLTFGLLSPNKGIETVIRALPRIVQQHPNALYVVLGATHPHLVAREGESYREGLIAIAEELGVAENVHFINAYVESDELLGYLAAADVYVTPYLHEAQITSGTLSHAVGLGKAVVSTPYWHAQELLADGIGKLVPFGDSTAIGETIAALFADGEARAALSARAYAKGRETVWSAVGSRYLRCFEASRAETRPRVARRAAPTPNLRAVERMSDQCGMLQHARFSVPDRNHGYCVDDNARALMLMHRAREAGVRLPQMDRLIHVYAAFVEHAWNDGLGRFRNFMSYDRRWLEEVGSEDSCGRAFWAVGETALLAHDEEIRRWALRLADLATPHVGQWTALRAQAFVALGLCALAAAKPRDNRFRDALEDAASTIMEALVQGCRPNWTWFEPTLAYDNARLPEALLRASITLDDSRMRDAGLETLAWLTELHRAPSGHFRPVGTESFGRAHVSPAPFDQQPLEAAAAIDAAWAAFDASGDALWIDEAHRAFGWYLGDNDLGARLSATDGGGCHDGLGPEGVNRNQGAESVLSYQLATCAMRQRERTRRATSF